MTQYPTTKSPKSTSSHTPTETSELGRNVYVASLPVDFNDQNLFEVFSQYGAIESARIMRKKGTRQSKGYGFVLFKNPSSADAAIVGLASREIGGNRIQVRHAHPDASNAYNTQRGAKSSSAPPCSRPPQPQSALPFAPPLHLAQHQELAPPQAMSMPAMMSPSASFQAYCPMVGPSPFTGPMPMQMVMAPLPPQAQQMTQRPVYYVLLQDNVSNPTFV